MIGELLTVQADVNYIEWIFVVKLRNVRQFAYNIVVFVMAF